MSRLFEILAYDETPLGPLCLRRRELISLPGTVVTEVTLDHEFLMSSFNTLSERALASTALTLLPNEGLDVLIGGLGLGYTAREALASPRTARVTVVELLPQVIAWLERDLIPLAGELKADPRLSVVQGDVFRRLAEPAARTHDLILIDVDHSPEDRLDDSSAFLYTDEGLRRVKSHLKPGGVLGVWSYEECAPFADALRRVFPEVRLESVEFENTLIDTVRRDRLFFASS